ncbi:hypothetical protein LPB142_11545 [Rhodobacter xanthinilyticus]|uniref:Uncharacterized protein n=1 Tax=Rhodobacter xanthinilyticus TaxID=1850250 RepID=A0A1D9MDD5_9RHOB|nr:hypothetical protein [Rhodobacter xanthinilyticus]AOZ69877.1 hypothetical protein LPB142_11545 [Rhodobacter xanthinilyticus]
MRLTLLPLLGLGLLAALPARAELVRCTTSLRGEAVGFAYDPQNEALRGSRSLREKVLGGKKGVDCPGLVTLRALTPELDDAGRAPFCLQWDEKAGTYLGYATGARDPWGHCRAPSRSFCERVNGSAAAAGRIMGNASGIAREAEAQVSANPVGAVVIEGQGARLGAKLRDMGASAVLGLSPAGLAAVAVTAVAVGGAVYVCSDQGAEGAALAAAPEALPPEGSVIGEAGAGPVLRAEDMATDLPATSGDGMVPMLTIAPPDLSPAGPPAPPAAVPPAAPPAQP